MSRGACSWVLGLGLATSSPALAGNTDTFYLGNEAALQGGASSATARGGTALWYNPAGLARLEHDSVDGSMTAFSLSLGQDVDFDSALPGSQASRLQSSPLSVVPASLSYTRRFSFGGAGVGLFVPNQAVDVLRTRLQAPDLNGAGAADLIVDGNNQLQEYYAGTALGFSLGPLVDVGAALFATYRSELTIIGFGTALGSPMGKGVAAAHLTEDAQAFGLQPVLGMQLHPSTRWDAGLTLRLPVLQLYAQSQTVSMTAGAMPGAEPTFENEFGEQSGFSTAVLEPLRAQLGLARQLGEGQLALELSYQLPQPEKDRRGVWNARLGGQLRASESWAFGGGLFSDRSPNLLTEESEGRDVNYYGISLGAQLDAPYGVVSRNGVAYPAEKPLIFRTTVVLSYMLGTGQIQRLELQHDANGAAQLALLNKDVIAHQIVLHFGASLLD